MVLRENLDVDDELENRSLQPLYARPAPTLKNPVQDRLFAQLGKCLGFEARPTVMHFGGFEVGAIHTQYLKILNISRSAKRFHILNPTTREFKVRVEKRGSLAPGVAETLAIDFEPTECRYYYDCIRIHTESENLLVPIHGYPVVNDVRFPSRVDFGNCPLGETVRKVVSLGCNVPIQFEYSVEVANPSPDFNIMPSSGLIPANGSIDITIEFTPLSFGTCSVELALRVSQFNFQPLKCVATGGCAPGMVRKQEISRSAALMVETHTGEMALGATSSLSPKSWGVNMSKRNSDGTPHVAVVSAAAGLIDTHLDEGSEVKAKGPGSGAVVDGGADLMSASAVSSQRVGGGSRARGDFVPSEEMVEGVLVPAIITGNRAVNYILTQKDGQLKPKALAEAIRHQRAVRAEQKQEQDAMRDATGGGTSLSVHAIKSVENASLAQLKRNGAKSGGQVERLRELAFLQELVESERDEKEREFKSSHEALGSFVLIPEELDAVVAQRERVQKRLSRWQRDMDRAATATVSKGPNFTDSNQYARAETIAGVQPEGAPSFDEFEVDVWGKRRTTLQRFVYLVGKWIVQKRAARRVAAIQARLAGATSREAVRSLVELDCQFASSAENQPQAKDDSLPEPALRFEAPLDCIQPTLFPCYEEDSSAVRLPIPGANSSLDLGFLDYAYLNFKVAQESEVMGYRPVSAPPVDSFAPPASQGLRTGAVEETGVQAPRDATPGWNRSPPLAAVSDSDAPPPPPRVATDPPTVMKALYGTRAHEVEESPELAIDALLCPPVPTSHALDTLRPSVSVRAYIGAAVLAETDADWLLRPQPLPYQVPHNYGSRVASSVGASALHVLKTVPTLSDAWRPRRLRSSSALFCLEEQHRQLVWQHQGLPPTRLQPVAADAMSDSESDDEGDDVTIPTMDFTRGFFDSDFESFSSGERIGNVTRDRMLLQLEAKKLSSRHTAATELPERLETIDSSTINLNNQTLLQKSHHTHGLS